jgi:catechol 2,3-dioxygenase-like lactoylglutathione lyase family enzyme
MSMFPTYHVNLYSSDIQKSVAFYNELWKSVATKVKPGYAKWELEGMVFSIVENPAKVNPEFGHLGIRVSEESELKENLERFKSLNFNLKEEMGTNCCYALQDKFWISDPDGHQWEYYLLKDDVEFNDPHYSTDAAEACCSPAAIEMEPVQIKAKFKLKDNGSCDPGTGCC